MSDSKDRAGLQNLFESISQQIKRRNISSVNNEECEQCKKEVLGFLEEFIKAIGDQSNARAFVLNHSNKNEIGDKK